MPSRLRSPLTIFGIPKGKFQRLQKTSLYLLGRFQEKYQRAKNNSVQLGQNYQNSLPTKLVGGYFFFSTSCREVGFQNSVQLGQNYFLAFFIEAVLKMPFSAATTGRDFFWDHSPKRQSHRLPLGETFWKIADEARIKSLVSPATIWEGLWTKSLSHRLPCGR